MSGIKVRGKEIRYWDEEGNPHNSVKSLAEIELPPVDPESLKEGITVLTKVTIGNISGNRINTTDDVYINITDIVSILPPQEKKEELYPCVDCGKLRIKAEGGTTFTVCDECWDKHYKKEPQEKKEELKKSCGNCKLGEIK